jgi:hypothetical protein
MHTRCSFSPDILSETEMRGTAIARVTSTLAERALTNGFESSFVLCRGGLSGNVSTKSRDPITYIN